MKNYPTIYRHMSPELTNGRTLFGEGPLGLPLNGKPRGVNRTRRTATAKQEARNIKKDFKLWHK